MSAQCCPRISFTSTARAHNSGGRLPRLRHGVAPIPPNEEEGHKKRKGKGNERIHKEIGLDEPHINNKTDVENSQHQKSVAKWPVNHVPEFKDLSGAI